MIRGAQLHTLGANARLGGFENKTKEALPHNPAIDN